MIASAISVHLLYCLRYKFIYISLLLATSCCVCRCDFRTRGSLRPVPTHREKLMELNVSCVFNAEEPLDFSVQTV